MSDLFRRWVLPGLVFESAVIAGGYATGRELSFRDREGINVTVNAVEEHGGGLRTLLHEVVQSQEFRTR